VSAFTFGAGLVNAARGAAPKQPAATSWYDSANANQYGGEGNTDFHLNENSTGNYQNGFSGSIEDLTHSVGGIRYLDADRTTAIDRNGTTYQRTGNNQWSTYQQSMGAHQNRYNASYGDTGWTPGDLTNEGGEGNGYQSRDSAAYNAFRQQTERRLSNTGDSAISAGSTAGPTANAPVANPVNHDFITGLQAQLANNTSAGLESAQAQGTANANQMRLAAGANTLGGNFAAAGAAGQSALSSEQQGDVAQANAVQSQAQQQNVSTLGKALQQQVSTDLASKSANLDQTMRNISDVTDSLRQDIGQATTQQGQQMKAYLDQLTALQQQYQNISANDAEAAQKRAQIAQTILSVAGTVAAIVK
jgi:hypothetical protein